MTHKDKHHHHPGGPGHPPEEHARQSPAPAGETAPPPAPGDAPASPTPEAPAGTADQAALRAEKDDLLKRLQRVSADYLNYQKRIQKEIQHSRKYANEELIKALLPVLDDIDRALETGTANHPQDDPLLAGLRLVREKAMTTLGQFGLTTFECEGKPFDPDHHSAVTQQSSTEHPANTVLKELRKGYCLEGRTIRPAMVMVSLRPEAGKGGAKD
jgi:molecular chaperone GrpE